MGNSSSSTGGRPSGPAPPSSPRAAGGGSLSSLSPKSSSKGSQTFSQMYECRPFRGFDKDTPRSVMVKLDKEALLLLDATTSDVYKTFSYYRILCWGWTAQSFQWKAYSDDTETELMAYGVMTDQGEELEGRLMSTIQSLIGDMKARGVPEEQFATLINTLQGLAEEGFSEHCLQAVKQMALGRAFDARQAVTMVETIGQISPFERLEAAVAVFPTLMSRESFHVVLQLFEDAGDRDNLLHRLGLIIGADGTFQEAPGSNRRKGR